jgi:hypothetical protein
VEAQDRQKSSDDRTVLLSLTEGTLLPPEGSVLLLGGPDLRQTIAPLIRPHCGERLELREEGVRLNGTTYEGEGTAVLVSCHRRNLPGSVLTVVYAVSPQAATAVAKLLFFYGWNSYVVFKDGTVSARGEWPAVEDQVEVVFDGKRTTP